MGSEIETKSDSAQTAITATPVHPSKPNNPASVKKAIALGKDVRRQPDKTKADAAREMYPPIAGESREIIVQARYRELMKEQR
jgi:hypothetical protein